METPTRTEPPYVPLRHSKWPTYRTPRWLFLAGAVVLAGAVLVGIAVHPSRSQRAADMNDFLATMTYDVQSCAGGVRESLGALTAIETGAQTNVATATQIASTGVANCSPANNMLLADLTQYQVHESLASFGLDRAANGLVTWAFPDAQRVMADVAQILHAKGAARTADIARLHADQHALDAQRAYVDKIMMTAVKATGATHKLPQLPS